MGSQSCWIFQNLTPWPLLSSYTSLPQWEACVHLKGGGRDCPPLSLQLVLLSVRPQRPSTRFMPSRPPPLPQCFATEYGINVTPSTLHTFQMGSNVAWHKMPYLAWSARAYSLVTAKVAFNRPEALSSGTPLWHNRLFSKPASLTYYCPQLIRQGVITVGDLINNSTHISQIAPTWASIYQQGVFHYHSSNLGQAPTNSPLHPVPGLHLVPMAPLSSPFCALGVRNGRQNTNLYTKPPVLEMYSPVSGVFMHLVGVGGRSSPPLSQTNGLPNLGPHKPQHTNQWMTQRGDCGAQWGLSGGSVGGSASPKFVGKKSKHEINCNWQGVGYGGFPPSSIHNS